MRKALIDIGTNTTHMLIADITDDGRKIDAVIYKKRYYTYLGEYGLKAIHPVPLQKLYEALEAFDASIKSLKVDTVKVVATEALRTASNGESIRKKMAAKHGWTPEIISGLMEARYIADGAAQAVDMSQGTYLVMDIGGGSVEFIMMVDGQQVDMITTPLGISRLYNRYQRQDPISLEDVNQLSIDVAAHLGALKTNISNDGNTTAPITMIGTAGSFELFLTETELMDTSYLTKKITAAAVISATDRLIPTTQADREADPDIPAARAKYILVAFLLMTAVIKYFNIEDVIVSKYALKEGAILSD